MPYFNKKSIFTLVGAFFTVWLVLKYLFPLAAPFLLGGLLAIAAEPLVKPLSRKLPRPAASALGVLATLVLLLAILVLLTAALVKELGVLAGALPDLGNAAKSGLHALEDFLLRLSGRTPAGVQPLLQRAVTGIFSSGSSILERLLQQLPAMASAVFSWLPDRALALGTGILSAFMASARLPQIRQKLRQLSPSGFFSRYLPALRHLKTALGGWLKAQLKLALTSYLIVSAGLMLLRVPYGFFWAFFIALVDAIPVLGTGTILLPWALISLLQNQTLRAVGLLATYLTAMLCRSVLEPKLVGKQLGMDPLVTLFALYAGYRIWGIFGMLLSPVICVATMELTRANP